MPQGKLSLKFIILLLLISVWVSCGEARSTHGVTGDAESRAWWGDKLGGYLPEIANCLHGTSVSTTASIASCRMYALNTVSPKQLEYAEETSSRSVTYSGGDGTYWLIGHASISAAPGGWTRVSGTHYLWQKSATPPTLPSQGVWLLKVTVSGSAVTVVEDIATRVIVGSQTVSASRTIVAPGLWYFTAGAVVTVSAGQTLTMPCPDAQDIKIFEADESATGAVRLQSCNRAMGRWWGALGDGAANDQPDIQDAVAGTQGEVGELFFSAGTYMLTGRVNITGALSITGEGRGRTIFKRARFDSGDDVFRVTGVTGFRFADFEIDGDDPKNPAAQRDPAEQGNGEGIRLEYSKHGMITRIYCHDMGLDCVTLRGDTSTGPTLFSSNITITDCEFYNNRRQGISVTGGDHLLIERNTIWDNNYNAIDLEPNVADARSSNISIYNNDLHTNGDGCISLEAENAILNDPALAQYGSGIIIEGNDCRSNAFIGMRLRNAHNVSVSGNRIRGNTGNGLSLDATDSSGTETVYGWRVIGNYIRSNTGIGLVAFNTVTTRLASGVVINGNISHLNGGAGILLGDYARYAIAYGNVTYDNTGTNLSIASSTGWRVGENVDGSLPAGASYRIINPLNMGNGYVFSRTGIAAGASGTDLYHTLASGPTRIYCGQPCSAVRLAVNLSAAPGAAQTVTVTVTRSGTPDTDLQVVISGLDTDGYTTVTDPDLVDFTGTQGIGVEVDSSAGAATVDVVATLFVTPFETR